MNPSPQQQAELVDVLRQLAEGAIEPEAWLAWWQDNSGWVAQTLKRGEFLRLKPVAPGPWGPPCRSALASQHEACSLLERWGMKVTASPRYHDEWQQHFHAYCEQQKQGDVERKRLFLPQIKQLETDFPRFSRFLAKQIDRIELLAPPADPDEIAAAEASLGHLLPASYRTFLSITETLELGDTLKLGLPYTVVYEVANHSPIHGLLAIGECSLEQRGDLVLFGPEWRQIGSDPPVLCHGQATSPPTTRELAPDFTTWLEKEVPLWKAWKKRAK